MYKDVSKLLKILLKSSRNAKQCILEYSSYEYISKQRR